VDRLPNVTERSGYQKAAHAVDGDRHTKVSNVGTSDGSTGKTTGAKIDRP
jgi:hypothetical protein